MGIWTWLDRFDRRTFESATAAPNTWQDRLFDGSTDAEAALGHIAGIHTHRAWHALHVALTGAEIGGDPPGAHVVWTTPGALDVSMTSACFMHSAETVREVADLLRTVDEQRLVANIYAARELGVFAYSFEHWEGDADMVQCGVFGRVLRDVVDFYQAAAAQSQVVIVQRG